MKTYIVNMEKDTQKRAQIETQLAQHPELEYQIWKAVEGRKLSEEAQKQMILPDFYSRYGQNATLPAVGCSLSHFNIYADMIKTGTEFALILEDDAILSNDMKLEHIEQLLVSEKPVAVLLTPDFWYLPKNKRLRIDETYNIYQLQNGYMTSGYVINLAAAKLLCPLIYPVKYMADAWGVFTKFGLNLYGIVPHVISYPDGYGEIGMSQLTKKEPLYKEIRHILGRTKARILGIVGYLKGIRKSKKEWI